MEEYWEKDITQCLQHIDKAQRRVFVPSRAVTEFSDLVSDIVVNFTSLQINYGQDELNPLCHAQIYNSVI